MATSGSQNYSQTVTNVINDAYQLLGIYGIGRTISSADFDFALRMLNKMVKAWGAKGLHLWERKEGRLYLTQYTSEYNLGNASTDAYVTSASDEVVTQLNGALAASATSVTVDSTTGMTVGDNIGVVLTDKTVHWTTIATLPSSTTLTLTTGVASAASDNALVYTFTSRIYKPLKITSARSISGFDSGSTSTEIEIPLTEISYDQYQQLPTKSLNSSPPTQFAYNPNLTNGTMFLFPRPDDGSYRIHFTYERIIEDLDAITDDFDFPSEWLEALTYQLAIRLGPAFGKTQKTMQALLPLASQMLNDLLVWDTDLPSIAMMPDQGD